MIQQHYALWKPEEYSYPVYGKFIPSIMTYLHDEDEQRRPALIIVPGGGYGMVSPSEGEVVAKDFYEKGYNTFVVTYTTNYFMNEPLNFQPLKDLSRAVVWVRKNVEKFRILPSSVAVCGFSAGGHLCGSLLVHYDANELKEEGIYVGISNRPDAGILSYPVITSGEYAHRDSFAALLGADASKERLEYMSLEKQVSKDTPPVFLWHTMTDDAVPVENSILFAQACKEQKIPVELHIFGNGGHGLSLANETWILEWLTGLYCREQFFEIVRYLAEQGKELPEPFDRMAAPPQGKDIREVYLREIQKEVQSRQPDAGIATWPELAHRWLVKNLGME